MQENEMIGTDLTSLCNFSDPQALLEAAYNLDQLGSPKSGIEEWKGSLKSSFIEEEYWMIVRRSGHKVKGRPTLEAVASVDPFLPLSKRRESRRRSSELLEHKLEDFAHTAGAQRVLVVEDSPTALKLMDRMITRLGHTVSTATNGVDALEMLKKDTFDIVLMDINMPLMNGLEASHEFRKIERQNRASGKPYQKIIAMSGDISNTLFHEVTNAGFDAFIPKPLTEERFYEVLRMPSQHK